MLYKNSCNRSSNNTIYKNCNNSNNSRYYYANNFLKPQPPQPPIIDGINPIGVLTDLQGNIYGTTLTGGTYGLGIIYKLIPQNNGTYVEQILHNFAGAPNDGNNIKNNTSNNTSNNTNTNNNLILYNNYLYGITYIGGTNNLGTIYKISTMGGNITILYNFTGSTTDGANPNSLLVDQNGNLYGLSSNNVNFIIFTFTNLNIFKQVYTFIYNATIGDQYGPFLITLQNNNIYYSVQGSTNPGTYNISTIGTNNTFITNFLNTGNVTAAFVSLNNDIYYYSISSPISGSNTLNNIFSYNPINSNTTTIYFNDTSTNNQLPGFLIYFIISNGYIYGISFEGGTNGFGTLYRITTNGQNPIEILYNFKGTPTDGANPNFFTSNANNTVFFVSTLYGGKNNNGAIVQLTNNNGTYSQSLLHSF